MRQPYFILSLLLIMSTFQSCLKIETPYTMVAPGTWRGLLDLRDQTALPPHPDHTGPDTQFDFSKTPEGVLPFHFEVKYITEDSMAFTLINGQERIPVSKYSFSPNIEGEKGRITLHFPVYDTRIVARVEAGIMEGRWIVDYRKNYSIPFSAHLGESFRFTDVPRQPVADIEGHWEVVFDPGSPDEYPAIGEFDQKDHLLTGTFATETGDYQFLEGTVSGEDFFLSSFNGSIAYLFEGKLVTPDSVIGAFYSGRHFKTTWQGRRNNTYSLQDAASITKAVHDGPVEFKAESMSGEMIDFDQPPYQSKVKIIEIMGSWCPNCHDETRFLQEWISDHPDLPVEIVSLAFERYEEEQKSLEVLSLYTNSMDITWPVIYGGPLSQVNQSPYTAYLDKIQAYPTLIVLDSDNRIRYVHTGFYGPATSEYERFQKEFDKVITDIVREQG